MDASQTFHMPVTSPSAMDVEISVHTLSGRVFPFELPAETTVSELKERLAVALGSGAAALSLTTESEGLRELDDGERLGSLGQTLSFTLVVKNVPPIDWTEPDGASAQIASVRVDCDHPVEGFPLLVSLAESPATLLRRAAPESSGDSLHDALRVRWGDYLFDGEVPVRSFLAELCAAQRVGPIEGTVAVLRIESNPCRLPASSILYGLSPRGAQLYGSHTVAFPRPGGFWGFIRLGDDGRCGMRMMFHPTCGNSTPSGRYLLEYLGQIHERSTLAPDSLIFNFARQFLLLGLAHGFSEPLQSLSEDEEAELFTEVTLELIYLTAGRIVLHQHAPDVPVEQHTVPHWTLILAKLKSLNVIMLLSQELLQQTGQLEHFAVPACLNCMGLAQVFIEVQTCAHLTRVPQRYNPTWLERRVRRWMFG
ncbi:unnamed protein product [Durusdinium trenchii]|uniref:Ubiquitin-like domain-containing protein n=1 Tax=Durusdinium trenchii TaxID=1381693 RepID=A0ABP0IQI7_9DINO